MRFAFQKFVTVSAIALLAAAIEWGCGGNAGHSSSSGGSAAGGGGTGGSTGGATMGGAGAGGDNLTVGSGGGAPASLCSGDLRDVLDGSGNVVKTCPPDQGCLNGACVAACDAANGSHSTLGCSYFAVEYPLPAGDASDPNGFRGPCFAAVVVNQWATPVSLTVSLAGKSLDASKFGRIIGADAGGNIAYEPLPMGVLPPNQVAVLFLSHNPAAKPGSLSIACPAGIPPAIAADGAIHETAMGDAFQIDADRPVTAYSVYPWGGAPSVFPSATLLLPAGAWEKSYVAPGINDKYEVQVGTVNGVEWTRAFTIVTASQDDTHVTLLPTVDVAPGKIPGSAANTAVTYTLKQGQYVQIAQKANLGGSVIGADKPVGLWVGSELFVVENGDGDATGQMIPPVHALGSEYVGATVALTDPTPWQIVGVVDGTELTYDPAPPAGAPAKIGARQVVEFMAKDEFTVKSQDGDHPFFMAVYRRGDKPVWASGPDYVDLLTPAQYRSNYVFVTDPSYKTTALVFIRKKGAKGFADVHLDCSATPVGGWAPAGAAGDYEVARVVFGTGNTCKNGAHEAHSDSPFGVTVWGWDNAASYGYPAGGNLNPVNDVEVVPVPK